jgi:microcystin-dependent protein
MGQQYVSEIRVMAFGFPPKGWALCNGQTMSIQQNQVLFALLGTTYGGNGTTTFNLPNLQGRAPVHMGTSTSGANYPIGQSAGEAVHTLNLGETPTHTHQLMAANVPADTAPAGVTPGPTLALAQAAAFEGTGNPTKAVSIYSTSPANATLAASAVGPTGGSQPHENRQPYLALNFCIALVGIFPSRN